MKKHIFILCFMIFSIFICFADNDYKVMSLSRYNLNKADFAPGTKICIEKVNLWSKFDSGKNSCQVYASSNFIYFSMSKSAMNWLLDYSEEDPRWSSRYLTIYGVVLEKPEGANVNENFRIEKIDFY